MKQKRRVLPLLACAALLAGCATQRELIDKRIAQRADFFAALTSEDQQRIREGKVIAGDPRDAAWIVYGRPDRVFEKVTATTTNEVWSYVSQDVNRVDDMRPVYHPVRVSKGRTLWHADTLWATDVHENPYEYLRIEFEDSRILTIESEKR